MIISVDNSVDQPNTNWTTDTYFTGMWALVFAGQLRIYEPFDILIRTFASTDYNRTHHFETIGRQVKILAETICMFETNLEFSVGDSKLYPSMIRCLLCLSVFAASICDAGADDSPTTSHTAKIRALLVTGGCCHDYDFQAKALQLAAAKRGVDVEWTIVNEGGTGTEAEIKLYERDDWADGFDVVIHNECFANTANEQYMRRITRAHKNGVSAVVIHCAMHTYRAAEVDDWREFLGVTSRRHEHKSEYRVDVVARQHPIMKGLPDSFKMPIDELYVIEKLWPKTKVLATSRSEKDGTEYAVFWTHRYGKARVFGTTYGHSNETFGDENFLNTVVQGMQWASQRADNKAQRADNKAKPADNKAKPADNKAKPADNKSKKDRDKRSTQKQQASSAEKSKDK